MRILLFSFVTSLLVLTGPLEKARAQESSAFPAPQLIEQSMDEAQIQEEAEKIRITVGKGITYEFASQAVHGEELKPFLSLSEEQQANFKERRLKFLTRVAQVLNSTKMALGAGSLVGKSFRFMKNSVKKALGKETQKIEDTASFRERSQRVAQILLNAFDRQLWSQAPLLVGSNEYGLSASVAVIALGGYLDKGAGGIQELGVSFAYNKESKAMVFELFHTSERFYAGEPFSFVLAGAPKVGVMINKRESGPDGMKMSGEAHGIPVLPAYISTGENNLTLSGMLTLGVPPSPIVDILPGFATKFEKNTLLRITVSPLVKGYVRLEFGDVRGSLLGVVTSFNGAWQALTRKIQILRKGSCTKVFALN